MIVLDPLDDIDAPPEEDEVPTATLQLIRRRLRSEPLFVSHPTLPFTVMLQGERKREAFVRSVLLGEAALEEPAAATPRAAAGPSRTTFTVAVAAFGLGMVTHALLSGGALPPMLRWGAAFFDLLR